MTAKTENSRGSGNPQIKINNESKENIASDCFRERKAKSGRLLRKGWPQRTARFCRRG